VLQALPIPTAGKRPAAKGEGAPQPSTTRPSITHPKRISMAAASSSSRLRRLRLVMSTAVAAMAATPKPLTRVFKGIWLVA